MRYINMGFTGMFSVETVLKIIGFGIKVGILENKNKHTQNNNHSKKEKKKKRHRQFRNQPQTSALANRCFER